MVEEKYEYAKLTVQILKITAQTKQLVPSADIHVLIFKGKRNEKWAHHHDKQHLQDIHTHTPIEIQEGKIVKLWKSDKIKGENFDQLSLQELCFLSCQLLHSRKNYYCWLNASKYDCLLSRRKIEGIKPEK